MRREDKPNTPGLPYPEFLLKQGWCLPLVKCNLCGWEPWTELTRGSVLLTVSSKQNANYLKDLFKEVKQ